MWKTILDLLFPVTCLGCGEQEQFICFSCFSKIPLNKKEPLRFSQKSSLSRLVIASYYKHSLVKQAIHCYKYDFIKELAKPLGQLMIKRLQIILETKPEESHRISKNSLLIPVPLHKKRLRWRGFNQAELLALEVGQKLNIEVANDILIRSKHSLPQVNIKSSKERKENIKKSFKINPSIRNQTSAYLKNKTVILIDDISTTGATLEECAQTLNPLNPKQIWGLVVARG